MKLTAANVSGALFIAGIGVLIAGILNSLAFGAAPMQVGEQLNALGAEPTGAANLVTAVLLAYRGFDTLGELTILFAAATAAGMVLRGHHSPEGGAAPGFVLKTAAGLLFPFLLLLGFYIILHGHVSPGGGFQGGAILAAAYFVPLLAGSGSGLNETAGSLLEGLAGSAFILIGIAALSDGAFLAPLGPHGTLGSLFSAGSLPLLSMAIGLKVGAELAAVLAHLGNLEEAK